MARITINGTNIEALEGEYILEVARANDIFIPSICYLSKCSPTLACKMCMIDIDGKRAYACNAKVKDGINIITNSYELQTERKAIMQSYAINHPLECGVCDKSGECELQDFVHLVGVNSQEYFIADSFKKMDNWSQVKYDPNLCILCERCVTTCKDNLGENNIKAVKQDYLPSVDSNYWKDKMPKDAFSVWNRKQKSLIQFVGDNHCFDCAECASVCPVGALGVTKFQYTSNAWELNKIDSTCMLCPSGCKITYEVKENLNGEINIYRVTNDFNFNPICSGGRFAYDIYPDKKLNNIDDAINSIKKAKYILVGGNVTNNEAKFLEQIRLKTGIKLVNSTLRFYAQFLSVLLNNNIEISKISDISTSKIIWSLGCDIKYSNPLLRYKINNTLKLSKDTNLIYSHPIEDMLIAKLSKKYKYLKYKPYNEYVIIFLILFILDEKNDKLKNIDKYKIKVENKKIQKEKIKEWQKDNNGNDIEITNEITKENIEIQTFYSLFEDNGITYDIFLELKNIISNMKPLIIIGEDVYENENIEFIAEILSDLKSSNKIDILLNPPSSNANGIISNLTLEELDSNDTSSFKIGFRQKGNYTFDSIEADFNIPFYHSINDSMTNIDNRILPLISVFKEYNYIELLADKLNIDFKITKDNLPNYYANDGKDKRGKLEEKRLVKNITTKSNALKIADININLNAYMRDISPHFYPYTKFSSNFQSKIGVYTSKSMLESLNNKYNINIGDDICLESNGIRIYSKIFIDNDMKDDYFAISPQIKEVEKIFIKKYCMVNFIPKGIE